ncbi:cystatin-D isoform X1 [Macaca nemestrina]|uniref:Cystatin D n=2 Tax=Macaca TaxID=9539 RepID=G7PH53_MACFA|nr:cystatin-D [Macaca fascicularis]XP_050601479.1 cystatin-D [Macaca thibetana thibetana]EHH19984.1 Cystatin-5 [Macaca mulatta]EHH65609.1 Cystatin-5 [Macaca fascicularis]
MAWPMRALLLLLTALMVVLARSASAQSRKTSSGDIHAADLNDKSVQRVLNFTIREYNKDISKDEYYSRPLQVMAAYQQVVGGVNYYFNVKFGRTTCTKSQPNLDNCPFNDQPELKEEEFCSFQINEVSQENKISILNYKCRKV